MLKGKMKPDISKKGREMAEQLRDRAQDELDRVNRLHSEIKNISKDKKSRRSSTERTKFDKAIITFARDHNLLLPPYPEL